MQIKHVQGGNVPGGHEVFVTEKGNAFITPMKECNSIPLEPWDVVVDIGAYVGTYAIRCARHPVRKVTAYEPTPETFEVLSRISLPNMTQVQAAVTAGDQDTVSLFISKGIGVTNSCILTQNKGDVVEVPAVRYEDAVRGATIVKIDVEGAEYSYPIVQPSLRALIVDFHPIPGKNWIAVADRMIEEFLDHGFRPVIEPKWDCGWTRAGSWIRNIEPESMEGYEPMLTGAICCGCGCALDRSTGTKSLCEECWPKWTKAHRKDFQKGRAE
jgi:FkbM family methyltransferase